ncbi:unnamed protein product [Paramecium primaurelia]|uniref:Uncharacterized protein n=1 Tax=Paramecium primaurelia TaxID=5886 RepID=A0A8S1MAM9_PARPR|nr:unnamed protein product [Paramecium primaurelia]
MTEIEQLNYEQIIKYQTFHKKLKIDIEKALYKLIQLQIKQDDYQLVTEFIKNQKGQSQTKMNVGGNTFQNFEFLQTQFQ